MAYEFYGKPAEDTYRDRTVLSQALIKCTIDSLQLEYGDYKNYVANLKSNLKEDLLKQERSFNSRLLNAKAQKGKRNGPFN